MIRYIFFTTWIMICCLGMCPAAQAADNSGNQPVPGIQANGRDIAITVSSGTPVSVTAGLATGDRTGVLADWWFAASTPWGLYSLSDSGWSQGINMLVQYPLFDFSGATVCSFSLPIGYYAFFFGVDTNPDGVLGAPLFYNRVQVHVSDTVSGAYSQSGGSAARADQTFFTATTDESGVRVANGGALTLENVTVTTTGNTSSSDSSSFYGLNAGVLAESLSNITLSNSSVITSGTGANGVFATGSGSSAALSNVTIEASGDGGHGVMATAGGSLSLADVIINTSGAHGAAVSTDRGGGTITVTRGIAISSGQDSPGIYSTGTITARDAVISGTGSEGAVIEGANSILLTNTILSGAKGTRDRGALIYQSMSGDAQGTEGTFTMTGGTFNWPSTTGPAFYVTNSTGVITLKDVTVVSSSGTLLKAGADQWGTSGANGGTVIFTADGETLTGNMVADSLSSITARLQNGSSLTGAINSAKTAGAAVLSLDATSTWTVTADSYLTSMSDADGISAGTITNINGNGHNVYYNASLTANSALGGKTYTLNGGGYLAPK
ncbi:MAG: hypothetical protein HY881_13620 [Deltaproteobacteria bacterium]|nr:hypothetical protein [Deltaproteobacteria bacterium]